MLQIIADKASKADGTRYGHRGYRTDADRQRAIKQLSKRGLNSFVAYREGCVTARETGQEFGLSYGYAEWAEAAGIVSVQ